ncbi:MAG TPA: RNA 3'-terminal phosphate cyclase [Candidatus Nanoarchaeia archaeon]|nr:RNA 3'-terminal phosphate cyclase [Candidatus Nanoarchaeia archaeon]
MADIIELDGSHGEGGGAILRQALALSMLTGKAFKITNIRKGRCNPGLAAQHLACVEAAMNLCDAEVVGCYTGSTEVQFTPKEFKGGHHKIDIGTAGSITLLLQSLLLPSLFCGKRVSFQITGGTDVKWSQPFDYFKYVFLPQMNRYGTVEANLFKRGYYPKGGGEVRVVINGNYTANGIPTSVLLLEQKKILQIRGVSHASLDLEQAKVAERQSESARMHLEKLNVPFRVEHQYSKSLSTGSGITLWAVFGEDEIDQRNPVILGADSLGERNKKTASDKLAGSENQGFLKAEVVGKEAAENLIKAIESGAGVDAYLADQLVPFMALSGGLIKTSKVTEHVKSNIYVAEKFLDSKFEIKENIISCEKKDNLLIQTGPSGT